MGEGMGGDFGSRAGCITVEMNYSTNEKMTGTEGSIGVALRCRGEGMGMRMGMGMGMGRWRGRGKDRQFAGQKE